MNLWKNNAPKIYLVSVTAQTLLALIAMLAVEETQNAYAYISYLIPQIANIGTILIFLRLMKKPISEGIPYRQKPKPICLLLTIPVMIGLYCQNLMFSVLFSWLMETLGVPMTITLPEMDLWWQILLSVLLICLLPALGEEMMFRGIIPKTFEKRGILPTIFLSALVFALAHGNAAQLVHQFILGAFLVYFTRKTGTIIYAVLIHFFNNLTALILELTLPAGALGAATPLNLGILFALFVGGILILYPSVILFFRAHSGVPVKTFLKNGTLAREVLWFTEPALPDEKISAWEIGMWAFLVLFLILNTAVGMLP